MKAIYRFLVLLSLVISIVQLKAAAQTAATKKADSLFFAGNWSGAQKLYQSILKDTSRNSISWNRLGFSDYNMGNYNAALNSYQKALFNKPIPGVKASVFSRRARIYALQSKTGDALNDIDSAMLYGYTNLPELDTLKDFNAIRNNPHFIENRQKVYFTANPCMANPQAREFDFWVGEWNVYVTGAPTAIVGHSLIQMVSSGCALLENWDAAGGASNGKSLNFVDDNTHKWKQTWVGSYTKGIQEFTNGEYKDGAMRFTFTTTNAQGSKITGRFIFYNEGPDKVRQFNETSADDGKTWTTAYDLTYVRVRKITSN